MKRRWKGLFLSGIAFFCFLELASLGFYFTQHGELFYRSDKELSLEVFGLNETRMHMMVSERLHPFFGYVLMPGPDFRPGFTLNNYGFISPYSYPLQRDQDSDFIVGVFGGSVASNYAIFEIQQGILQRELQQRPELAGREVKIISLANGGYKQPQQLLILNYMLAAGQEFDLVINIDGFNEMALSAINHQVGLDTRMPSASHVAPLTSLANSSLSTDSLQALFDIQKSKEQILRIQKSYQEAQLASSYPFLQLSLQASLTRYQHALETFQELQQNPRDGEASSSYYYFPRSVSSNEHALEQIADHWVRSSQLMNHTLSQHDIPYLHVLQPNQYHATQRKYSAAERRQAFDDQSPYATAIQQGYPLLIEYVPRLEQAGIHVLNAVDLFDPAPEIMYIDNCCHYTPEGHLMLSERIATELQQRFEERGL